jgi:hypothetical protein
MPPGENSPGRLQESSRALVFVPACRTPSCALQRRQVEREPQCVQVGSSASAASADTPFNEGAGHGALDGATRINPALYQELKEYLTFSPALIAGGTAANFDGESASRPPCAGMHLADQPAMAGQSINGPKWQNA